MVDNITGMPGGNYSTEGLYRVKALDRDARGGSGGEFERQTRKEKNESESAGDSDVTPMPPPEPAPPRQLPEFKDDVVLSDVALRSSALVAPGQPVAPVGTQLPEEPQPPEDGAGRHIDVTA